MFDGFWHGVFGGWFGPAIVQWVKKYKYSTIFIVVTFLFHLRLFISDIFEYGLTVAIDRMLEFTFTPVGILAPFAVGGLAVACLFFCLLVNGDVKKDK